MAAVFEKGKRYYTWRNPDTYLTVEQRTDTSVTVRGWKVTRQKLMVDENGDEYFEIMDPFKGASRYSARNIW